MGEGVEKKEMRAFANVRRKFGSRTGKENQAPANLVGAE